MPEPKLPNAPIIRWRCAGCKGLNIQVGMWVDPNTGIVDGIMDPASWVRERDSQTARRAFWCFDCQTHQHGVESCGEGDTDAA